MHTSYGRRAENRNEGVNQDIQISRWNTAKGDVRTIARQHNVPAPADMRADKVRTRIPSYNTPPTELF